jgi:peptidoglycan/xylan/chitin deacetylase (PgdA/CDA1 family)
MAWLRDHAAVVSLENLISGEWPDSPAAVLCAITFDDGYASVFRWAYPVLCEMGFPATVYLVAQAVGDTDPKNSNDFNGLYPNEEMLRWQEVKEMQSNGLQFGSHLLRHKDLTSLNHAEQKEELEGSKRLIEDRLGAACPSFCYPWGKHDDRSVAAVRNAGYRDAVVAIQGRWQFKGKLDQYRIPRADIRRDYSLEDFAAVVRGDWDYLGYLQRFRRWTR